MQFFEKTASGYGLVFFLLKEIAIRYKQLTEGERYQISAVLLSRQVLTDKSGSNGILHLLATISTVIKRPLSNLPKTVERKSSTFESRSALPFGELQALKCIT